MKYVILLSLIFSIYIEASEINRIRFGANAFIPPYVIKNDPNNPGVFLEIALETFKEMGHPIDLQLLSNKRILISYNKGDIDSALFLADTNKLKNKTFESIEIIKFQNGFICKTEKVCNSVLDKKNKFKVVGFQNAKNYVDDKYREFIKNHKGTYYEVTNQRRQVLGLLSGDYDVLFMDYRIFQYHLNSILMSKHPLSKKALNLTVEHKPWASQPSRLVAFKSEVIRDKFNKAFLKLKEKGLVTEIYKKYGVKE